MTAGSDAATTDSTTSPMASASRTETAQMQADAADPHPRRGSAWLRVAPAMFLLAWGGNHFTPLVHMYEEDGGYAIWQANLLLGMYVGGLIPGLLVASALSDRRGRKPILIAGTLAAIIGSVLLGIGFDLFWLLCVGRVLAGVGVGVAMSVGTSWIKELSFPPFDHRAGITAGARRPALTLTVGFAMGAAVTGCLAQWGPLPETIPYAVHTLLSIIALIIVCHRAGDSEQGTVVRSNTGGADCGFRSSATGPSSDSSSPPPRGSSAPQASPTRSCPHSSRTHWGSGQRMYATVLTVVTLGAGALVQNPVPRINNWTGGRALVVGLGLMSLGMVLAVVAALVASPILAFVVAIVLGIAYGTCVVAGLILVQAIAAPDDLAGITGVYYSLAYSGFLLPTVLAALLPVMPYSLSLAGVAVVCLLCLAAVARASNRRW